MGWRARLTAPRRISLRAGEREWQADPDADLVHLVVGCREFVLQLERPFSALANISAADVWRTVQTRRGQLR